MKKFRKKFRFHFRYRIEYWGVVFFAKLVPLIPLGVLRAIADGLGWIVFHFDRKSQRVALANLEAAFGNRYNERERRRIARRAIQIFGRSFLELFWTPRLNPENVGNYLRFEDEELFAEVLASKRTNPVIGVTIHFANFEWASAYYGFRGYQGAILTQRFKNDRLTPIFLQLRSLSGQTAVTQEQSVLRFFKALKRGRPVGILVDLTMKMADPGVILAVFGLKIRTTLMHAALQQRTGAPIMPFACLPQQNGKYVIRTGRPMQFPANATVQEIAQKCWEFFEPLIREHPEQWLWSYKHWRYRPAENGERYPFYANYSDAFEAELHSTEIGLHCKTNL